MRKLSYFVPQKSDRYHLAAYAMCKSRDPLLSWSKFVLLALDTFTEQILEAAGTPGDYVPPVRAKPEAKTKK